MDLTKNICFNCKFYRAMECNEKGAKMCLNSMSSNFELNPEPVGSCTLFQPTKWRMYESYYSDNRVERLYNALEKHINKNRSWKINFKELDFISNKYKVSVDTVLDKYENIQEEYKRKYNIN